MSERQKQIFERLVKAFTARWRRVGSRYRECQYNARIQHSERKIFIDCGANTCSMLRQFIRKYPDFRFFAFEPQPDLVEECTKVRQDNPDTEITCFQKAVWITEETREFYLANRWGPNYRGGSTLETGHRRVDYSRPLQVEAIDFSRWLHQNFCERDYIIVKMDIEGSEYKVLEKIVRDKTDRLIDELKVEFHDLENARTMKRRRNAILSKINDHVDVEMWR